MYLIVTRHKALVEYLRTLGITGRVIEHATPADLEGHDVVGVLPLHLAQHAASVTEVPLDIPAEMRGKELSLDDVTRFAKPIARYVVRRVPLESNQGSRQ